METAYNVGISSEVPPPVLQILVDVGPEQNLTSRDALSSRAGNSVRHVTPCLPVTAAHPGEGQYASVQGRQQTNGVDGVEGALI